MGDLIIFGKIFNIKHSHFADLSAQMNDRKELDCRYGYRFRVKFTQRRGATRLSVWTNGRSEKWHDLANRNKSSLIWNETKSQ